MENQSMVHMRFAFSPESFFSIFQLLQLKRCIARLTPSQRTTASQGTIIPSAIELE
jgi:hypothetical protein